MSGTLGDASGSETASSSSCDGKVIPTPDKDRGKDYNHSTFLDLIIAGLVGIRAAFGAWLSVEPLADPATISHFALDNVFYHGRNITVAWDPEGTRYQHRSLNNNNARATKIHTCTPKSGFRPWAWGRAWCYSLPLACAASAVTLGVLWWLPRSPQQQAAFECEHMKVQ